MRFTKEFKKKTRNSHIRSGFAWFFNVSYFTINDWLDKPNADELTKPKYWDMLMSITGMTMDEIFEKD